ncbi:MAG: sigma-70 family RNA polymerase sigma factor [Planctomycetota bacterium]|nr:MAG: sigma-70 family RNA polymerase sigma factor [Planctomycetota bacterium]
MSSDDVQLDQAAERMLLQQALAGDREAWQQLMELHAPRLAAYLGARLRRHLVVEKLVSDTIYAAWRHRDEYSIDQDFGAWLRRLGAHLAMRWHERHRGEPLAEAFPRNRCEGLQQHATMQALDNALGRLSDKQRMALEQRYRAGLVGAALAQVLHLQPGQEDEMVNQALEALDAALSSG